MSCRSMNILIANDDGFDAPGLRLLIEAMEGLGDIAVAAPDDNHSGASSSLTLARPIRVRRAAPGRFRVGGTPSDCVHLALTGGFTPRPDLLVSGVNDGANMGDDTIYSGTVAAAIEGHLFGVPGFAFSMAGKSGRHFAAGAAAARMLVQKFLHNPPPGAPLFNVNIPDAPLPDSGMRPLVATRLGRRHPAQPAVAADDNHNGDSDDLNFRIGEAGDAQDNAPGTDFHAVAEGGISITPLSVDLTDAAGVEGARQWLAQ